MLTRALKHPTASNGHVINQLKARRAKRYKKTEAIGRKVIAVRGATFLPKRARLSGQKAATLVVKIEGKIKLPEGYWRTISTAGTAIRIYERDWRNTNGLSETYREYSIGGAIGWLYKDAVGKTRNGEC